MRLFRSGIFLSLFLTIQMEFSKTRFLWKLLLNDDSCDIGLVKLLLNETSGLSTQWWIGTTLSFSPNSFFFCKYFKSLHTKKFSLLTALIGFQFQRLCYSKNIARFLADTESYARISLKFPEVLTFELSILNLLLFSRWKSLDVVTWV